MTISWFRGENLLAGGRTPWNAEGLDEFVVGSPVTVQEAIDAIGLVQLHELAGQGLLRIQIVDGSDNLVHRVEDPHPARPLSGVPVRKA